MSCQHDCQKPPAFPATIRNRPGLDRIGYRIGDYASFRAHLLARLDKEFALAGWTHRSADEPGIALLEGAALVGEVLAFYQTLYANEAFLRTADWRESVAALVALTGYRLAAGAGGQATFALAVKGGDPVTVPQGFGFKAKLEGQSSPAIFESTQETVAYPALNQFHLYRPRRPMANIRTGQTQLELHAVGGASDLSSRQAIEFNPGDRVMLVPDSTMYDANGRVFRDEDEQAPAEVLVVKKVETVLDRIIVTFEGQLTVHRRTTIRAFKIGRSFRHFGHNAPRTIGRLNETTGIMEFENTVFRRKIGQDHTQTTANLPFYSNLLLKEMPFDTEVKDLATGGALICQGQARIPPLRTHVRFAVVRRISAVRSDTLVWGGMSGACSVATLGVELIANPNISGQTANIRRLQFHEVTSPELTLRALSDWADGDFGLSTELAFYGTYAEARTLTGRSLLLADTEGVLQTVVVATGADDFDLAGRDEVNSWLWPIQLDQPPRYQREAFSETDNAITVYGNLVAATQGETQDEIVLGNGDAREIFQTFALPKAPLTYQLDQARTPPSVPELEIYVGGILWERVETFFNSGPADRVYVVREDDDGNSLVQFGDGKTGARLPSGRNNVVATYRVGTGARGELETDAKPKAVGKLTALQEVFLPEPAVGGADPETADMAREASPLRMQSLGRLVGLADYEAEALMLPGVLKACADWAAPNGTPRMRVTVLTEGGSETEAAQVAASLTTANACRGPGRFPIETVQGLRQFIHLNLTVGYAADRRADDIRAAVTGALGVSGAESNGTDATGGLFSLASRRFGQSAHVSQVIGAAQQVDGVMWVRVDAFESIPLGDPPETEPEDLAIPDPATRQDAVDCARTSILVLHALHLILTVIQDTTTGGCES